MLDLVCGRKSKNCAGISRRDVLKVGALSLGGVTLADALQARAESTKAGRSRNSKSAILFYLDGGPTQHETFDPKPDAPSEYKGPFEAIQTALPGVFVNEFFPKTAQIFDKLSLIRSVHHGSSSHSVAAHWVWSGYGNPSGGLGTINRDQMYPSIGSIVAKLRGPNRPGVPAYLLAGYPNQDISSAAVLPYEGSAFLGVAYNPFDGGGDPNRSNFQVPNLSLADGITQERVSRRRGLLASLDTIRRESDTQGMMDGMDQFKRQAFELITSENARKAFDISREDPKLRDRYGRNSVGQGALMARRLVEAGVTFATVQSTQWDRHSAIKYQDTLNPPLDAAISTLVEDLDQRGLYEDVIVMVMGEFGRTPKVNRAAGRDHWPNVYSVLLSGGGLKQGQIVGASDAKGASPIERPVKPAHVLHTVYHQLGIDTTITHLNWAGRPIPVLSEGEPISELI